MPKDAKLRIVHVATGAEVPFEDFALTEFQDNVSTKYNETPVFGRMDPIVTYQGTTRNVTFAIRIQTVNLNIKSAIAKLSAMQYPTYANEYNALTISRPPLIRVTLGDLLDKQLCAMDGFAFTPLTGFTAADSPIIKYGAGITDVIRDKETGQPVETISRDVIEFKSVTMKFNLRILHEEPLGFNDELAEDGLSSWLGQNPFAAGGRIF